MTVLLQNALGSVTVLLENKDGSPAINLTEAAMSISLKKEGASSFSNIIPTSVTELGGGTYSIGLTAAHTDTIGNLYLRISGTTIRTILASAVVTDVLPVPPEQIPVSPTRAGIFGFVLDVSGEPVINAPVYVRVVGSPVTPLDQMDFLMVGSIDLIDLDDDYIYEESSEDDSPSVATSAISIHPIVARTDGNGYFYIVLSSGLDVDLAIPAVNFRRTFTVPPNSINLFQVP